MERTHRKAVPNIRGRETGHRGPELRGATSITKSWKPSTRYAVLLYTIAEKEFLTDASTSLKPFMRIVQAVRAMVELNPDDPDLVRKLTGTPWELGKDYEDFENTAYNYLLARAPTIGLPQGIQVAIAPESIEGGDRQDDWPSSANDK
jgi:hypothetical protein